MVIGPAGAGRTSALGALAAVATAGGISTVEVDGRGGDTPALDDLASNRDGGHVLVLIDDADLLPQAPPGLEPLLSDPPPGVHVVVAVRTDRLRSRHDHWTGALRAGRTGVLLRPDIDIDGDLLRCRLPTGTIPRAPGSGVLVVDGMASTILLALP
jgi:S-DNA-T family DNA segregation ATPase FtsK/SpoIIIE